MRFERIELRSVNDDIEEFFGEELTYKGDGFEIHNFDKTLGSYSIVGLCIPEIEELEEIEELDISREDMSLEELKNHYEYPQVRAEVDFEMLPFLNLSREQSYDIFVEKASRVEEVKAGSFDVDDKDLNFIEKLREKYLNKAHKEVSYNENTYTSKSEVPSDEFLSTIKVYYNTSHGEVKLVRETVRTYFSNATIEQAEEVISSWK